MVTEIETTMNDEFEESMKHFDIHSIQFSQNEQLKNEQAFKKLHPLVTLDYREILQQSNFQEVADRILGNSSRRPLIPQSKNSSYMFYTPKLSSTRYPFRRKPERLKTEGKAASQSMNHRRMLTTTSGFTGNTRYQSMRTEQTLTGYY